MLHAAATQYLQEHPNATTVTLEDVLDVKPASWQQSVYKTPRQLIAEAGNYFGEAVGLSPRRRGEYAPGEMVAYVKIPSGGAVVVNSFGRCELVRSAPTTAATQASDRKAAGR